MKASVNLYPMLSDIIMFESDLADVKYVPLIALTRVTSGLRSFGNWVQLDLTYTLREPIESISEDIS